MTIKKQKKYLLFDEVEIETDEDNALFSLSKKLIKCFDNTKEYVLEVTDFSRVEPSESLLLLEDLLTIPNVIISEEALQKSKGIRKILSGEKIDPHYFLDIE